MSLERYRGHRLVVPLFEVMSEAADLAGVRAVIRAQLSDPAPAKPDGVVHPIRLRRNVSTEQRCRSRRQQTLHCFTRRLMKDLRMNDPNDALDAFELVAG